MSSESLLDQEKFWNVINYLIQLDYKKSFDDICHDLNITGHQLNSFISFLKEVNYEFDYLSEGQIKLLSPPPQKPQVTLEFNLLEWLQFQAHFPFLSLCQNKPFHVDFVKKLSSAEQEYCQHDLFMPLETLNQLLEAKSPQIVDKGMLPKNEIISFLEEAILGGEVLNLIWDDKNFIVYPRKIVFLDGELRLIAESLNDKCLINMSIDRITQVFEEELAWQPHFSRLEIDDFISGIRSICDNGLRLVLKIYNREKFDHKIPHHHFEKPCLFTNPQGDFIWAATTEPSDDIFEWLSELGADVEILDPIDFKKTFLNYCEHKLKKMA